MDKFDFPTFEGGFVGAIFGPFVGPNFTPFDVDLDGADFAPTVAGLGAADFAPFDGALRSFFILAVLSTFRLLTGCLAVSILQTYFILH